MKNKKTLWLAGAAGVLLVGLVAMAGNSGYLQGRFDTSATLTRAEVVEALVTAALGVQTATCGTFSDVPTTASYNPYVCAAFDYGIITGDESGTFGPDETYARSQVAKLVYNAFGASYSCELPQLYRDVADGQWYTDYVNTLGILEVYGDDARFGNYFRPNDSMTTNALNTWLTNAMAGL
jgi:hypothetical protein